MIDDAILLVEQFGEDSFELPQYQLLRQVLMEQTEQDTIAVGKTRPKDKKAITPDSFQNPSDPDATFQCKTGKSHKQ